MRYRVVQKENDKGALWAGLTDAQKQGVVKSEQETEDESKWVAHEDVKAKYAIWLIQILLISLLFGCKGKTISYRHPETSFKWINPAQVDKYNVKKIMEGLSVPGTNPDSLIEPIGMMVTKEYEFDKKGRLILKRCVDCAEVKDSSLYNPTNEFRKMSQANCLERSVNLIDVITTYEYDEKGQLAHFFTYSVDTTESTVMYHDSKSITKGYKKDRHLYTSIEQYDSVGRIKEQYGFDFDYIHYDEQGNVHRTMPYKTEYIYDKDITYIQYYYLPDESQVNITAKQLKILKSDDIREIMDISSLYKLRPGWTEIITINEGQQPVYEKLVSEYPHRDEYAYEYYDNGLLHYKKDTSPGHKSTYEYRYEAWQ